ncbi:hypothetical protein GCM10010496_38880 [Streptomyces asoensis]|nr:hypothetical protein GCM10010496_38880 [Streptomyces asoensis]
MGGRTVPVYRSLRRARRGDRAPGNARRLLPRPGRPAHPGGPVHRHPGHGGAPDGPAADIAPQRPGPAPRGRGSGAADGPRGSVAGGRGSGGAGRLSGCVRGGA